jgi:[ribosomal protein S5]-alanine N-acetyltransferase
MKPTTKIRPLLAGGRCDSSNCPARQWAALLDRSLAEASREAGIALTPYFVIDDAVRLWRLRVSQIAADPGSARWVARTVGRRAGRRCCRARRIHGPSDQTGMVEVAYSVDPAYRRRG